jgi:uncharacterized RDD family membrane protein YckC
VRRRLAALAYEALLLTALAVLVGFVLLPLVSPSGGVERSLTVPPVFVRTMMFCALVGAGALYFVWSWSGGRRTLAQKTWRLRLANRFGAPPSPRQALLRYLAAWIGPAAALAGYAALQASGHARGALALVALNYCWAAVDPERQFLHDRIAGTRVARDAGPADAPRSPPEGPR